MYSWPLEPFDRAHPVRGYFNDPRISGSSRAFHFGIDIAAPNGTPVYAARGGVVHLGGPRSASVEAGGLCFGYWHVVPAVRHRQRVRSRQLLGHVEAPWLHVTLPSTGTASTSIRCDPAPSRRGATRPGHA